MSNKLSTNSNSEGLEAAFAHFNTVTDELIKAYQQLEIKVEELNLQLAQANDELLQKSQTNAQLAQRLAALLNALPAGVVETDSNGTVISRNNAARAMLPATPEYEQWPQQALAASMDKDGVIHVTDPGSGQIRYLTLQTCPLDDLSTILLLFDVSALRQLHQQLAQQNKLASMGQMAASLAHQLRTPLATALLYAKNLERPELGAEDRLRFSRKIVDRLQALEDLIREMLGFVKHSAPAEHAVPWRIDHLLEEIEQSFAPQCERRGVTLDIGHDSGNTTILCRPKELTAAVINLLENALAHAPEDGHIMLEVQHAENSLTLKVKDNGPGVPQELVSRIFEPFFTTRASGTGLGLAIAKRVIDGLGGELRYDRDAACTIFSITLPKAGDL